MSTTYEVMVEAASGNVGRWGVLYYRTDLDLDAPATRITGWLSRGNKKFSASIGLGPGDYVLQGDVATNESKISVTLTPEPPLTPPVTQPWPLVVERGLPSHAVSVRYFTVPGAA